MIKYDPVKYGACVGVICGYLNHNKQIGENGHVCNNSGYSSLDLCLPSAIGDISISTVWYRILQS